MYEHLKTVCFPALQQTIVSIVAVPGGRNSLVYRLLTGSGDMYLVKKYRKNASAAKNRCVREFDAFTFLWKYGIRQIPQPVYCNEVEEIGMYRYIEGSNMKISDITSHTVYEAVQFIASIQRLRQEDGAGNLPEAAEASFTLGDYMKNLTYRRERLNIIRGRRGTGVKLNVFLGTVFDPFHSTVVRDTVNRCQELRLPLDHSLPATERILSPSDFGFHNAIRRLDGTLVFFDFEYFGWDDPAKLTADFFLQPDLPPPRKIRPDFVNSIYRMLGNDDEYAVRLRLMYPILALKWCLILLNVFLDKTADDNVRLRQLEKSEKMFNQIREEYKKRTFPLSL